MRSKRTPSESDPIRDAAPGASKLRGPMLPLRHFRAMPKAVVGHGFRFQAATGGWNDGRGRVGWIWPRRRQRGRVVGQNPPKWVDMNWRFQKSSKKRVLKFRPNGGLEDVVPCVIFRNRQESLAVWPRVREGYSDNRRRTEASRQKQIMGGRKEKVDRGWPITVGRLPVGGPASSFDKS